MRANDTFCIYNAGQQFWYSFVVFVLHALLSYVRYCIYTYIYFFYTIREQDFYYTIRSFSIFCID